LPSILDPCAKMEEYYFDGWFPFLKNEQKDMFNIETKDWFE